MHMETNRCMVTPHPRRSLTLSTLLITSRPRLSKTRTFHIGSPSEVRIGFVCGISPLAADSSGFVVVGSRGERFRFRIFSNDAKVEIFMSPTYLECLEQRRPTYLPVSQ